MQLHLRKGPPWASRPRPSPGVLRLPLRYKGGGACVPPSLPATHRMWPRQGFTNRFCMKKAISAPTTRVFWTAWEYSALAPLSQSTQMQFTFSTLNIFWGRQARGRNQFINSHKLYTPEIGIHTCQAPGCARALIFLALVHTSTIPLLIGCVYPHLIDVETEAWNGLNDLTKVSQILSDTARSKRSLTRGVSRRLGEGQIHLLL